MKNGKLEILDLDSVTLDFENPRIRRALENRADKSDIEGLSAALEIAIKSGSDDSGTNITNSFDTLRESIKEGGSITHPIIVNVEPDGTKKVIEGNTRAFIYKNFRDNKVQGNWDKIPALVFNNISKVEIESIRLQSHLVGPRQWDPHSKGKYLHHLWVNEGMSKEQIIGICGGNKTEISNYIDAYSDMEKYYRPIAGDSMQITQFSGFVELQRPAIAASLAENGFTKSDFAQWMHDGRFLNRLRHVRQLTQILAHPEAKKAFLNGNSQDAMPFLMTSTKKLDDVDLIEIADELNKRISDLPWEKIRAMKSDPNSPTRVALAAVSIQLEDFQNTFED